VAAGNACRKACRRAAPPWSWMCLEVEDDRHLMVRAPTKGGRAGTTNSHLIAVGRARRRAPSRSHSTAVCPPIGGRARRRGASRWRRLFLPRAWPPRSPTAGAAHHIGRRKNEMALGLRRRGHRRFCLPRNSGQSSIMMNG
jgi:hypothetical protein